MLRFVLLSGFLFVHGWAIAESAVYNRVDFQVEAAREVANDLLTATLSVDIQDRQRARVAQQMNAALNDALKKAAAFNAVKARSGNQQTFPVYGKNKQIEAWRGHGEIRIESRDFKTAGELIMQLQSGMQLGGVQFSVAPDTRTQIEETLITEAIKTFRQRAEAIRAAVGAKSYKTVHLAINSQRGKPHDRADQRDNRDTVTLRIADLRQRLQALGAKPCPTAVLRRNAWRASWVR